MNSLQQQAERPADVDHAATDGAKAQRRGGEDGDEEISFASNYGFVESKK